MQKTAVLEQISAPSISWKDAVDDFLLQVKATREEKTVIYYHGRLKLLKEWAEKQEIPVTEFKARHLRQYLAERAESGVSDATRRHDAVSARAFLKFCVREEYIEGDPLRGYQAPKSARPYVKCPSDEEIKKLLEALHDRWLPSLNPEARFVHVGARLFFSRRNYAIIAGLIETACRIGEMLALTLDDYDRAQRQIVIRKAKGDEPRIIPIRRAWMDAVDAYLKVRPSIESNLLFISEYGEAISTNEFAKRFRGYLNFAGISGFSLHGLRHYAISTLAKQDVWATSQIAGHKDLTVTRSYLHGDPVHVRSAHEAANPLGRILVNVRSQKQNERRKVV